MVCGTAPHHEAVRHNVRAVDIGHTISAAESLSARAGLGRGDVQIRGATTEMYFERAQADPVGGKDICFEPEHTW